MKTKTELLKIYNEIFNEKSILEIEYVLTDSEVEALLLECNLIKKNRPKFNVLLKDDKMYPYIKVTLNELYPTVRITRKKATI